MKKSVKTLFCICTALTVPLLILTVMQSCKKDKEAELPFPVAEYPIELNGKWGMHGVKEYGEEEWRYIYNINQFHEINNDVSFLYGLSQDTFYFHIDKIRENVFKFTEINNISQFTWYLISYNEEESFLDKDIIHVIQYREPYPNEVRVTEYLYINLTF